MDHWLKCLELTKSPKWLNNTTYNSYKKDFDYNRNANPLAI
jgi:hypothetical protein